MEAALECLADKGKGKFTLLIQTREVYYVGANERKYLSSNQLITSSWKASKLVILCLKF